MFVISKKSVTETEISIIINKLKSFQQIIICEKKLIHLGNKIFPYLQYHHKNR